MATAGALFWLFLPEKYTINMPIQFANSIDGQQIFDRLRAADGYNITIYASELPGIRALVATDTGDIIASHPKSGKLTPVYSDSNMDGRSDGRKLLIKGLNRPHGITLHDGWLYIAETDAVLRIKYDAKQRKFLGVPHITSFVTISPVAAIIGAEQLKWSRTISCISALALVVMRALEVQRNAPLLSNMT